MSQGLAIAKIGVDALEATDPNDFIFHSDYNTFKIIAVFTLNVTLAASTSNQSFTQAHGLSFIPLVRGFAKTSGVARVFLPNSYDVALWTTSLGFTTSGVQFNYLTSDATNITVNFNNTNGSTKDVSIRLFCLEGIAVSPPAASNGDPTGRKLVVAKANRNALTETDPRNLKFSSDYGTLKYFNKISSTVTFTADGIIISGRNIYTHSLGYYPYAEAFVRVYIGSPSGDFEPVPFVGSGASVLYDASMIIKENTIELYGQISGVSSSTWNFEFLLFLYRNNLSL